MTGLHGMGAAGFIGGVIGLAVVALLMAAILMVSTRIAAGFRPRYWPCYGVVIAAAAINFIISLLLRGVFVGYVLQGVNAVIGFVVVTLLMSAIIKRPDEAPLGMGKSAISALIYSIIMFVIGVLMLMFVHHMQSSGLLHMPPAHS